MNTVALDTDYLVIGTGAMGMAFTDELLTRTKHDRVILVDRLPKPGGHWNHAYGFVSLHQPAAYYGVNSEKLGSGGAALASGAEVMAYYERVMAKLLRSGRLQYFPSCEYQDDKRFTSIANPQVQYEVKVRKKIVDATYMKVNVPSTHTPAYEISEEVTHIPINDLVSNRNSPSGYVVIGAGKTGIDAVLYLIDQGVDPELITWIISNDAWFLNRVDLEPNNIAEDAPSRIRCLLQADSIDDYLKRREAQGRLFRLDKNIWPTKYRCATVSPEELDKLRQITKVVRSGRVLRIDPTEILLEKGRIPTHPQKVHIDCTANGLHRMPIRPVFDGDRITLQSIFLCQQVFSASLIAYLESRWRGDARKNAFARPIPHPEVPKDFVSAFNLSIQNIDIWSRRMPLWLRRSRLAITHHFTFYGWVRNAIKMIPIVPRLPKKTAKLLEL